LIISWGFGIGNIIIKIGLDYIFVAIAKLPPPVLMLDWTAIFYPTLLGLFIPLIANIVPIRRALGKTLRDSLDITHQSNNETNVRMIKLAELGLGKLITYKFNRAMANSCKYCDDSLWICSILRNSIFIYIWKFTIIFWNYECYIIRYVIWLVYNNK
jgi:hypothetical protein